LTYETAARNFSQQVEDQADQVTLLKTALHRLEQKMSETRAQTDLLIARHRRARLVERAGIKAVDEFSKEAAFLRMGEKVDAAEANGNARMAISEGDSVEKRLERLDRADRVDKLLAELKQKAS
jgi:phage shock protein A